uniref:P2X purinoceptor 4-like isoform X2 n=1 Tax=Myxine glutinosa TaxID=7769 RepID=UPI00358EB6BF
MSVPSLIKNFLCDYSTERTVRVQRVWIAWFYRVLQLLLLVGYVFVYVIYVKRGYRENEEVVSSVSMKVKGVAITNKEQPWTWDPADYVVPPQEMNSFFVMTNFIMTSNQKQGTCPESPDLATCKTKDNCKKGYSSPLAHGVQTGRCVSFNRTLKTCEVNAWCGIEKIEAIPNPALLFAAEDFTVLIKNQVTFPMFNLKRHNIPATVTSVNLSTCIFHPKSSPHCPVFRLGDIVNQTGENFQKMAVLGGIIGIQVTWDCNLHHHSCLPTYSFIQLEGGSHSQDVAPGYNFRFSHWFMNKENVTRMLIKAFGIRFDIMVSGYVKVCCDLMLSWWSQGRDDVSSKLERLVSRRSPGMDEKKEETSLNPTTSS